MMMCKNDCKYLSLSAGTVKDPLPLPPASVIPLVLETSGRLGPSALGFIQRISGSHTYLRSQLLTEITFICAIYSGRVLEATRELNG